MVAAGNRTFPKCVSWRDLGESIPPGYPTFSKGLHRVAASSGAAHSSNLLAVWDGICPKDRSIPRDSPGQGILPRAELKLMLF